MIGVCKMREIKFRAWDVKNNKMSKTFTFFDIESDGGYGCIYNAKIFIDTTSEIVVNELLDIAKYILMQFTGVKDKNGKEIYEGDIINQYGYKAPGIVRFGTYIRKDFSNHDRQVQHHGWYFEPIPFTDKYDITWNNNILSLVEDKDRGFEVIGNIYEDKHLLGDEEW